MGLVNAFWLLYITVGRIEYFSSSVIVIIFGNFHLILFRRLLWLLLFNLQILNEFVWMCVCVCVLIVHTDVYACSIIYILYCIWLKFCFVVEMLTTCVITFQHYFYYYFKMIPNYRLDATVQKAKMIVKCFIWKKGRRLIFGLNHCECALQTFIL